MLDGRRPFQPSTSTVLGCALLPKLVLQANILLPNFPNLQRLSPLFSLFTGPSAQSWSFLNGSLGNESTCSARDTGDVSSSPGLGISPGEENCNPRQYSCLENPMDRRPWQARVQGVAKSWKRMKQLMNEATEHSLPSPKGKKLPRVLMVPSFPLLALKINMHALFFMGVSSNHYKNMDRDGNRINKHGDIMMLPK